MGIVQGQCCPRAPRPAWRVCRCPEQLSDVGCWSDHRAWGSWELGPWAELGAGAQRWAQEDTLGQPAGPRGPGAPLTTFLSGPQPVFPDVNSLCPQTTWPPSVLSREGPASEAAPCPHCAPGGAESPSSLSSLLAGSDETHMPAGSFRSRKQDEPAHQSPIPLCCQHVLPPHFHPELKGTERPPQRSHLPAAAT